MDTATIISIAALVLAAIAVGVAVAVTRKQRAHSQLADERIATAQSATDQRLADLDRNLRDEMRQAREEVLLTIRDDAQMRLADALKEVESKGSSDRASLQIWSQDQSDSLSKQVQRSVDEALAEQDKDVERAVTEGQQSVEAEVAGMFREHLAFIRAEEQAVGVTRPGDNPRTEEESEAYTAFEARGVARPDDNPRH